MRAPGYPLALWFMWSALACTGAIEGGVADVPGGTPETQGPTPGPDEGPGTGAIGGPSTGGAGGGTITPPPPAACEGVIEPGPAPVRRLTQAEYDNTVRELLGDTSAPARAFQADGVRRMQNPPLEAASGIRRTDRNIGRIILYRRNMRGERRTRSFP